MTTKYLKYVIKDYYGINVDDFEVKLIRDKATITNMRNVEDVIIKNCSLHRHEIKFIYKDGTDDQNQYIIEDIIK